MIIDYILNNNKLLRILILLISVIGLGFLSFALTRMKFWGYLPMIWLVLFYLLFVGIFWSKITKNKESVKRYLLSSLTGILLAVSFPVSGLTPIVFFAFVPLFYVYKDLKKGQKNKWTAFSHAYNALFIWNILTTFWVLNTSFMPGIVANVVNALLMSVPWLCFYIIYRRSDSRWTFLSLISFYTAFEYLHMSWELSWPWLSLGNFFADSIAFIQWYEWTGFYGGAMWIWALNIYIFFALNEGGSIVNIPKGKWIRMAAIFLMPVAISWLMYNLHEERGDSIDVCIVQPNYEPHYEKFSIPQSVQLKKISDLIKKRVDSSTDFLLLPETIVSRVRVDLIQRNNGLKELRNTVSNFENLKIVSGISSYRILSKSDKDNLTTRVHVRNSDTTYWDAQNSAIMMSVDSIEDIYFKSKLVPGAEIFPFRRYLPFLKPIIDQLQGSVEGHKTQEEREVFKTQKGSVAPVICYESIYGDYVGEYIRKGAEAIFIMTNDGWWDNTPGHKQHLAFARLRAVEHRRAVARAANTGVSCYINQRGDVLKPTGYGMDAAIENNIYLRSDHTFYTQWGDYIAQIAILISILFIVRFLANVFIPMKQN